MLKYLLPISLMIFICSCDSYHYEYYADGNIEYKYMLNEVGQNGEAIRFYPSGEIMQKSIWVNGVKEGESKLYYKNGTVKVVSQFENNYQEGWAKMYDSSGNLAGKTFYKKSIPEGPFETYYLNGNIKSEGEYSNNANISETYFYYEDGSPNMFQVKKNDTLFYLKEYTRTGGLGATYFPIEASLKDDKFCVKLLYSLIPSDSVSVRVYFQKTQNLTINVDGEYIQKEGLELCTKFFKIDDNSIIEGFLCEHYFDISYGCTPFVFDAKNGRLISSNQVLSN